MRSASHPCRDDLLARSRRGALSAVERRALDAHLGVCELCQAARAFAALYDGVPDRPGAEDDALVARLADRIADRGAVARPPAANGGDRGRGRGGVAGRRGWRGGLGVGPRAVVCAGSERAARRNVARRARPGKRPTRRSAIR